MGLLATATGVLGKTRSKVLATSSRILSSGPAIGGTKACVLSPACKLNNNDSNRLMLMVQHVIKRTRDYSAISTDSFQVVKDNLPNFSFLRAEDHYRLDPVRDCVVLSSCNMWILFTRGTYCTDPRDYLWNPKTNEIKTLPYFVVPPSVPRNIYERTKGYGVGFDSASQDYKVVRSRVYDLIGIGNEVHVELFSLATGSWKEIPYPHDPYIEPILYDSLHINGFYYWLARCNPKDGGFCIISFDFANEKFPALIPTPPSALIPQCTKNVKGRLDFELGEYYGSLAAVVYNSEETKPCFEIWVWNNNIDEWSCESAFDVPSAAAAPVDKIVGLCKNDKLLLQDSEGDLLLYDYVEEKLTNLGIRSNVREVEVFPYMEISVYG